MMKRRVLSGICAFVIVCAPMANADEDMKDGTNHQDSLIRITHDHVIDTRRSIEVAQLQLSRIDDSLEAGAARSQMISEGFEHTAESGKPLQSLRRQIFAANEKVRKHIVLASIDGDGAAGQWLELTGQWLADKARQTQSEHLRQATSLQLKRQQSRSLARQQSRLRELKSRWQLSLDRLNGGMTQALADLARAAEFKDMQDQTDTLSARFLQRVADSTAVSIDSSEKIYVAFADTTGAYATEKWSAPALAPKLVVTSSDRDNPLQVASLSTHVGNVHEAVDIDVQPVVSDSLVFSGERLKPYKDGIQYSLENTIPVRAPASGFVEFASRIRGHGTVVVIRHDESFRTVMKNLGTIEAREGQTIRKGDAIGFVASTGDRVGTIYIETWKDDAPIDTLSWWASQNIGISG